MVEQAGLHVKITGDASGLKASTNAAIAGFAKLESVTKRAQTVNQRATAGTNKQMAAFRAVAANTKIAAAGTIKYSSALKALTTTTGTGAVATKGLVSSLGRSEAAFVSAGTQAKIYTAKIRSSRFHTANLGAQFNDIGVMLAAGQSPLMLAVQQGTQISQVFTAMGGTTKEQMKELGKAFLSIVRPTALLTIGVIAAGAALVQWGMRSLLAKDASDQLGDAIGDFDGIASTAEGALDTLTASAKDMAKEFGEGAARARELAVAIARLTEAELQQAMEKKLTALGDELGGTFGGGLALGLQRSIADSANKFLPTDKIRAQFVSEVHPIFSELAEGTLVFAEQGKAVTALVASYERFGIPLNTLPAAVIAATSKFLNLETAALRTARAVELALNPEKVVAAEGEDDETGTGTNKRDEAALFQKRMEEEEKRETERVAVEIERLLEEYATKLELEQQFFDSRLQLLYDAREKGLLTEAEFNRLSEAENLAHNKKLQEIDEAVNRTRLEGAAGFFGDMANAFAQGSDKMMRIAKVFGAAQALINAWGAFTKVLNDDELPWYMRIPAALGVLVAGLNAVKAIKGVGKGGGATSPGAAASAGSAGQAAPTETSQTTSVNISMRGQTFDRGAVIGLIEQINEAVGDGARIRAT